MACRKKNPHRSRCYKRSAFECAEVSPILIKPNNHELEELFGVTLKQEEDIIVYAKSLQEMGAVNVLISMAGDGALLLTEDGKV